MIRLMGLTEEQRLEIEQVTGIKTEPAQLVIDNTQQMIDSAIRELQEVIGPHGSVTRLQAGGIRITPGMGIGIYEDGVLKTTMKPGGDLVVGSNIEDPATTTLCCFVNDQTYNNEDMGAGDMLVGDNSGANMLYDASAHQLQFRNGQTVNVYIDTDGTLKAGTGHIVLGAGGINILQSGDNSYINFYDSAGAILEYSLLVDETTSGSMQFVSRNAGGQMYWILKAADTSTPHLYWGESPVGTFLLEVNGNATPTLLTIGQDDIILATRGAATSTVFNEGSFDVDFRIESNANDKALFLDASEETLSFFGAPNTSTTILTLDGGYDKRFEFGADHYIPIRSAPNPNVYFNEARQDMDFNVKGTANHYPDFLFHVDAGLDAVGISGPADSSYKLQVTGDLNVAGDYYKNGTLFTSGSADGWNASSDTWTRTGDYVFTVSGNVTATYRKGAKVRYKDGGGYEYGTIISSSYSAPNTTVTLATNSDYAMAAATITDKYISYIENPEGFPQYFNFTPSWTNVTVGNGTQAAIFTIKNGVLKGNVSLIWAASSPTSSISGQITLACPVSASSALVSYTTVGAAALVNAATALYMGEAVYISGGTIELRVIKTDGTYAVWSATSSTVPFSFDVDDRFTMEFSYFI